MWRHLRMIQYLNDQNENESMRQKVAFHLQPVSIPTNWDILEGRKGQRPKNPKKWKFIYFKINFTLHFGK